MDLAMLQMMSSESLYMLLQNHPEVLTYPCAEWEIQEYIKLDPSRCKICQRRFANGKDYEKHFLDYHQKDMNAIVNDFFSLKSKYV